VKVSIGVTNPAFADGILPGLRRVAGIVDESEVDTLWLDDHLIQADPTAPVGDTAHLEVYTTLGYLAASTHRIRLGVMVSPVTFREPAVLIAAVTTLGILSRGRAWLGVGAGHDQSEADDLGLPFPGMGERLDRTEDTLRLAHQLWTGDETLFEGKTVRLERPRLSPVPTPRPPILIGGAGEKRTLRMVATYGDACNVFDLPDDGQTVRHKLAVLARHCVTLGRDPNEIETTLSSRIGPSETTDELVRRARVAAGWGIDHLVLGSSAPWSTEALRIVTDAASRVRDAIAEPRAIE
jgi:alkanesulfonate monooxygenase SsuD/methylene tetrahydromethanopterin reductase-like flavin-dependent oxidoreductase (luciferase family)